MSQVLDIVKGSYLSHVVSQSFPGYRKKKVIFNVYDDTEKMIEPVIGGWDGGSCSVDCILDFSNGYGQLSSVSQMSPFGLQSVPKVKIDENRAKVTTETFCGKTKHDDNFLYKSLFPTVFVKNHRKSLFLRLLRKKTVFLSFFVFFDIFSTKKRGFPLFRCV
jgi:hypothetical protein